MIRNIFLLLSVICIASVARSQHEGFYVDGYLLYNKDTTHCRIWFNPDTPVYKNHITVWMNEQESDIYWQDKEIDLSGFGITQSGYRQHYGKLRVKTVSSEIFTYVRKVVTGTVEVYEAPVLLFRKANDSYKLESLVVSDYYIARSDDKSFIFPVLLNPIRKKKLAPYLKGYPEDRIPDKTMTPEQLVEVVNKYNEWHKQTGTSL